MTLSYGPVNVDTEDCDACTGGPVPVQDETVNPPVPSYLIVEDDVIGTCNGCNTTVKRFVTYQVTNSDGTAAPNIGIGENASRTGWTCSQSEPGFNPTSCSAGFTTNSAGDFADGWTLSADGYTPIGCGANLTDEWMACPSTNVGHLAGYIHDNAVSINGVVNPPSKFLQGTRINP